MRLLTTVSASVKSGSYDGMAYIYCHDPKQDYCFSLARRVDSSDIEVMVVDQVVHRVDQLEVALHASGLVATLSTQAASLLDGHSKYEIEFLPGNWSRQSVEEALAAILRGKDGLTVSG